jgi:hypothetical protein
MRSREVAPGMWVVDGPFPCRHCEHESATYEQWVKHVAERHFFADSVVKLASLTGKESRPSAPEGTK